MTPAPSDHERAAEWRQIWGFGTSENGEPVPPPSPRLMDSAGLSLAGAADYAHGRYKSEDPMGEALCLIGAGITYGLMAVAQAIREASGRA